MWSPQRHAPPSTQPEATQPSGSAARPTGPNAAPLKTGIATSFQVRDPSERSVTALPAPSIASTPMSPRSSATPPLIPNERIAKDGSDRTGRSTKASTIASHVKRPARQSPARCAETSWSSGAPITATTPGPMITVPRPANTLAVEASFNVAPRRSAPVHPKRKHQLPQTHRNREWAGRRESRRERISLPAHPSPAWRPGARPFESPRAHRL